MTLSLCVSSPGDSATAWPAFIAFARGRELGSCSHQLVIIYVAC